MYGAMNPFIAYAQTRNALNQLQQQKMASQADQDKLNALPSSLAATNQGLSLDNILKQIQANYAPSLDQSKLAQSNAMLGFMPLKEALAREQLTLDPQKLALQQQQLQQSQSRFSNPQYIANNTLKALPTAQRSVLIAQQPSTIYGSIANAYKQAAAGNPIAAGNAAANNLAPTQAAFPAMTTTPDDIAQLKQASELAANRALTTASTNRQQEGGEQVKALINSDQFNNGAKAFAQYAGAIGKGKEYYDKWSNTNQNQLNDAMSFKQQMIPFLSNRIKTLDGMGSTDAQRQELQHAFSAAFTSPSSNPARAMASIKHLQDTINSVEDAVNTSANKVFPMNSGSGQSNSFGGFSMSDINAYAKQNGMSVAQVQQMIKERQ